VVRLMSYEGEVFLFFSQNKLFSVTFHLKF
jgi:hypothetical protein